MHPLLLLQHDRPLAGFSPKKCSSAKPGSASDLVSSTNPLAASQVRRGTWICSRPCRNVHSWCTSAPMLNSTNSCSQWVMGLINLLPVASYHCADPAKPHALHSLPLLSNNAAHKMPRSATADPLNALCCPSLASNTQHYKVLQFYQYAFCLGYFYDFDFSKNFDF